MTVTKRKPKARETGGPDPAPNAPTVESGIKASCDSCSADVTHNVHIRCAEQTKAGHFTCPDFDLCVPCFLAGKSVGPHRANHAYRIISSHSFPIFSQDWGADEELLLIEGAEMYGLGNWADGAEHVGGRTKEECYQHYMKTYIESDDWPLPRIEPDFSDNQEEFQKRKKARLEELQSRPVPLPPPKPLASAPTCHEIAGFMPGRLEFETEIENEAETLVKDMEFAHVYEFGGDSQPAAPPPEPDADGNEKPDEGPGDEGEADLELKLSIIDIFNEKYDKRMAGKELMFDRGLMNYKQISANERKKSKEERDLINRTKVFARIQTAQDHEDFVDGLLYEMSLRKRIAELQEYRRMGVTTLAEGERYDHAKSQRPGNKSHAYRDSLALSGFANSSSASGARRLSQGHKLFGTTPRPTTSVLTLASSGSLQLLTPLEAQLCSTLRILPRPFLYLKESLLREYARLGGKMTLTDAQALATGMSSEEAAEKLARVWEFLKITGGLQAEPGAGAGAGPGGDESDDDGVAGAGPTRTVADAGEVEVAT